MKITIKSYTHLINKKGKRNEKKENSTVHLHWKRKKRGGK